MSEPPFSRLSHAEPEIDPMIGGGGAGANILLIRLGFVEVAGALVGFVVAGDGTVIETADIGFGDVSLRTTRTPTTAATVGKPTRATIALVLSP
jgi:hypothetical protein